LELTALGAGAALCLLDAALLWISASLAEAMQLAVTAAAVILFAAVLLAVFTRVAMVLTARLGPDHWRRSGAGALLALPIIIPLSCQLFRGTGISRSWYASLGPYLVGPLLLLGTFLGLRVAGLIGRWAPLTPWRRWFMTTMMLFLAVLLILIDRRFYPNQYLYLHGILLLLTTLALMAASWLALAHRCWGGPGWRWMVGLQLFIVCWFCLVCAFSLHSQVARLTFAQYTHTAERLAVFFRWALDFDNDHHSIVLGEQDCDNGNAAVYPFAFEVPGNGRDEDCDGHDEPLPSASTQGPQIISETTYAQLLPRWRQEPAFRIQLQQTQPLDVLFIVVDSLRADQLADTAENRQNHPHLMALIKQGQNFSRAFSTGAGTDIGMATLFTGQLDPFAAGNLTLLRAYQRAGFHTWGVFQREVERWLGQQFSLAGLDGRNLVVNDPGRRDVGTVSTSRRVTDQGLRFLHMHGPGRFFLWVHFFDVHEHHQIDPSLLPQLQRRPPARGLPFYRAMIRLVDEQVGRLLRALEEQGLASRTMVVLVGDHGEGLAQNPRLPANHGDVLYNQLVHVPLSLRLPGLPGRVVTFPVSLADLFPTLLDLSGIPAPKTHGISLTPWLFDLHQPELHALVHPLVMYEARQRGLVVWPYKLLVWLDKGLVELYQLERDYPEEHNLADAESARARSLAQQLHRYPLLTIDRLAARRR
jgi:hypothetical protein